MAKPPNVGTIIAVAKRLLGYFNRTPIKTIVDTPQHLTPKLINDMFEEAFHMTPRGVGTHPEPWRLFDTMPDNPYSKSIYPPRQTVHRGAHEWYEGY